MIGGEIQLTDRLRADLGVRVEYNDFVQSSENTSPVDLDGKPATPFDNFNFGNNSFRHFSRNITDWSGIAGTQLQTQRQFVDLRHRAPGATRCLRSTSS